MNLRNLQEKFTIPQFPKSSKYDARWLCENKMGPCAVWLTEFLTNEMHLKPGMKVLDMGCGMGISSIFLAKEFDVTVFANDLWISATDNLKRIEEAGLADRVFPIHSEAHSLPYAENFFDAIISIDSYHYYGTADTYLHDFIKYLKPEGEIGIVVPGLTREIGNDIPEKYLPYWPEDWCTFHSPEWWKTHFEKSRQANVIVADKLDNGCEIWLEWETLCKDNGYGGWEIELLELDKGNLLTFSRLIANRKSNK